MQKPGLFGMNGFILFLLTCLSFAARGQQQGYLILVDAENKQPFVMRVGDQSYFSSDQGHLVLPQLKDSTYELGLRIPRKNMAEWTYTVAIHRKDLGFQLKDNDSSMILFNWQTKEIIRPVYEKDSGRMLEQGTKKDDGFSRLMAAVVNDTAVMYNTYTGNGFGHDSAVANIQTGKSKSQIPTSDLNISASNLRPETDKQAATGNRVPETTGSVNSATIAIAAPGSDRQNDQPSNVNQQPVIVIKDSLRAAKRQEMHLQDSLNTVRKEAVKDSIAIAMNFINDSLELASGSIGGGHHTFPTHIRKLRDVSLKISRKLVFLDIDKYGHADTVSLFVYFESADTVNKKRPGREPVALKKPLLQDSASVKKIQVTNKRSDTTDYSKSSGKNNPPKTADAATCSQAATESDTEALRSAILKANSEQEKIAVAAGAFAIKCYSVSQIRFLASLLVSDKAKFSLMDAAQMHITDRDRFPELVDMLTDKNFQRKFLVMAEKRS